MKLMVTFLSFIAAASSLALKHCFETDSITCIQLEIYKTVKYLMSQRNLTLGDVFTITNTESEARNDNQQLKDELEEKILVAKRVSDRQLALEQYFFNKVFGYVRNLSFSWSADGLIRSLIRFVPTYAKIDSTADDKPKGRQKNKKQNNMLLPLLMAVKLKMAALTTIAYITIAAIAKKALLASTIALLVSAYIGAKNLIETSKTPVITGYTGGSWDFPHGYHSESSSSFYDWDRNNDHRDVPSNRSDGGKNKS